MSDIPKRNTRLGLAGQADRAAEVDEMIRRAQDPDDDYDGSDDQARAIVGIEAHGGKGTQR